MSAARAWLIILDFLRDGERYAARLAPLGALLLIAGAAMLTWHGAILAAIGIVLLLLSCKSRRDGLLILGPLAWAELARRARLHAPRTWIIRSLCALGAGAIVLGNFSSYLGLYAGSIPQARLSYINGQIANWFIASLFIAVVFLSMQLFPTALVEERIAKRWDMLRTTDLRPREILLGKLFGRIPAVLEPLLATAPIVAILPFYGAVSPLMMLSLMVGCIGLAFGIGGVGLFYSLFAKKSEAAIGGTLLFYLLYMVSSALLLFFSVFGTTWMHDCVYLFGSGNPGVQFEYLNHAVGYTEIDIFIATWHFALFHFGIGLAFLMATAYCLPTAESWDARAAISSVAAVVKPRSEVPARPKTKPGKTAIARPPVTDWPITWWERYGWLNPAQAYVVRAMSPKNLAVIAAVTFITSLLAVLIEIGDYPKGDLEMRFVLQSIAGILVAYGSLYVAIAALFRAARCMARERQGIRWNRSCSCRSPAANCSFKNGLASCSAIGRSLA